MQPFSSSSISLHLSFQAIKKEEGMNHSQNNISKSLHEPSFCSIIFDMFSNLHCPCLRTYAILGSSA